MKRIVSVERSAGCDEVFVRLDGLSKAEVCHLAAVLDNRAKRFVRSLENEEASGGE